MSAPATTIWFGICERRYPGLAGCDGGMVTWLSVDVDAVGAEMVAQTTAELDKRYPDSVPT